MIFLALSQLEQTAQLSSSISELKAERDAYKQQVESMQEYLEKSETNSAELREEVKTLESNLEK